MDLGSFTLPNITDLASADFYGEWARGLLNITDKFCLPES